MNIVVLIGRIANDLELREVKDKKVCNFNLAINMYGSDKPTYIPCVVWDKLAENLCQYKKKGEQIAIRGFIKVDLYKDENENMKKDVRVVANNIEYVGNSPKQENNDNNINVTNNIEKEIPNTMVSEKKEALEDIGKEVFGNDYEVSDDDLPFETGDIF